MGYNMISGSYEPIMHMVLKLTIKKLKLLVPHSSPYSLATTLRNAVHFSPPKERREDERVRVEGKGLPDQHCIEVLTHTTEE